jgi:hypothetical protein
MKRLYLIAAACCLFFAAAAPAQVDLNFFKHSSIAKYLNPVVGKGAEYRSTEKDSSGTKTHSTVIGIVGKDTVEGRAAFWMEVTSEGDRQSSLGKMLITRDDFAVHRTIFKLPGQQAMEMPLTPIQGGRAEKMEEKEWRSVGIEPLSVPAGTFLCEHFHNDKTNEDMWSSDKVTPFGMVKLLDGNTTTVLARLIPEFQDRITGPVKQFDPQAFKQQMMQKQNQNQ